MHKPRKERIFNINIITETKDKHIAHNPNQMEETFHKDSNITYFINHAVTMCYA
jgi:hypothetical protein